MTLPLTDEQARAVAVSRDEPLRLTDPKTGAVYVLLGAGVYDRIRALLEDDTVYASAELLDRIMADDDAHDPQLAALQKKYGGRE